MASTPPPVIGKAGNLTVFITPPATPSPVATPHSRSPDSPLSSFSTPTPIKIPPRASPPLKKPTFPRPPSPAKLSTPPLPPPPVQVPPPQYEKAGKRPAGSVLGFFWGAVVRVQGAHASLDDYVANWFGLDQSKYQWALNDYYEATGKEMDCSKASKMKQLTSKVQNV